jgi:nucleoid DNA-binding protein
LQGKVDSFKGPKDSRAISRQIALDCKEKNIDLSDKTIYRIVGLFFRHIVQHMKKGDFIRIDELGDFGMKPEVRKKREKEEGLKDVKKRYLKRKRNTRMSYNYHLKVRWRAFNAMRESKELSLWSFKDWMSVNKSFKMRRIRRNISPE